MSFNSNDINTGNYEEFFILYMDNELTQEQRKMVESFLEVHPELRGELDILLSTQLPAETVSFNKESLLSSSMKLSAAEEELLLYIDNELPASEKNRLELELASNKDYQNQHAILLQTKLDAADVIAYPNKEELYHRSTRVIAFKFYLRIAAVVLLVAGMGSLYYFQNGTNKSIDTGVAVVSQPINSPATNNKTQQTTTSTVVSEPLKSTAEETAANGTKENQAVEKVMEKANRHLENNPIAYVADPKPELTTTTVNDQPGKPLERSTTALHMSSVVEDPTQSFDPSKQIINNSRVTSALAQRNTSIKATESEVPKNDVADNKESKGSFKSFLRKATRMIERKTGIDPTNGDDEELLVGALAVKLK
ncbi:MAG TPA: hypothetical protein VJ499_00270 [Flavisolibacter sp.]|nr:hypothetical protein [Flavisolibacter sp.]